MASSITLYNHTTLRANDATGLFLATGTFKISLHTSSYTPSAAHAVFADLTNEITTAGGYSSGGETLASVTLGTVTTNDCKFDAADKVLTAAGGDIDAWRYAVIRRSDTVNSLVGPLIGYIVGNTTGPTDIPATTSGNTLTFTWDAAGIVTWTYT